jgi:hypothetical protein
MRLPDPQKELFYGVIYLTYLLYTAICELHLSVSCCCKRSACSYCWFNERSDITAYLRLKKFQHLRMEKRDLQQLFHFYIFPYFAK